MPYPFDIMQHMIVYVVITYSALCCCSPGDPEGGAWARQKWRNGCGWHHAEERLLHRGAQSEETLTDRTEKGRNVTRGEIISKRADSVVTFPHSAWVLANNSLNPPAILWTISEKLCICSTVVFSFSACPWIKRLNQISWVDPSSTPSSSQPFSHSITF